jgi:hypothetical protein
MGSMISWGSICIAKPKVLIQISLLDLNKSCGLSTKWFFHKLISKRKKFLVVFPLIPVFKLFHDFRGGLIVV